MMTATVIKRHDGRRADQLRSLRYSQNVFEYAPGSLLFEQGKTKILCSVTIQHGVPPFLRGKNVGWLTAEYALLPASTAVRTTRESSQMHRQGRSVEISRLISRTLRTVIDMSVFPDKTIHVDCDVLQADGGTRTASITAGFVALSMAQKTWLRNGVIDRPFIVNKLAAVSVGIMDGVALLDPDFYEDSEGTADFNFIMTLDGKVVEVQGGGEKAPVKWDLFMQAGSLAHNGVKQLLAFFNREIEFSDEKTKTNPLREKESRTPLFSLQNRKETSTIP